MERNISERFTRRIINKHRITPEKSGAFLLRLRGKCVADYAILRVFLPFWGQVRKCYKWLKYAENGANPKEPEQCQEKQSEFMKS
jgi:hypothetical protein